MTPAEIQKELLRLYQRRPDGLTTESIATCIEAVRLGEGIDYARAFLEDAERIVAEELDPWRGMSVKAVLALAAEIGMPKAKPRRPKPPDRPRHRGPNEVLAFKLVEAGSQRSKHGLGCPPSLRDYVAAPGRAARSGPIPLENLTESIAWTEREVAKARVTP
jgi:hypothetical protein